MVVFYTVGGEGRGERRREGREKREGEGRGRKGREEEGRSRHNGFSSM